jgi:rubrerythrin
MSPDRSVEDDARSRGRVGERPVGGEPVCLMHRMCPACGGLADEDPPTRCPRCDAVIEEQ